MRAMPAAAQAITVRVPDSTVGHLRGDRLVWGQEDHGRFLVKEADAAGKRRNLGSVDLLAGRSVFDLAIGGDGVFAARTTYPESFAERAERYTVTALGGSALIDCAPPISGFEASDVYDRRIAGDGTTVVSPGAGCRGDAVLVRSPGVPDRFVLEPGAVVDQRVDGDWLAAIVDIDRAAVLVVSDLRTQRESYRIPLTAQEGVPSFGPNAPVMDVDRDGTAVVGEPRVVRKVDGHAADGLGCRLWWASPADPRPHDLRLARCAEVALHDGVLALTLRDGPQSALITTDLAQRPRTTVRRAPSITAVDLASGRVAWSEQSCRLASYVRTAPLRPERDRKTPGCVVRVLDRGPLRMDARGRVRVRVACPNGCVGTLYVLRCNHRGCIPRVVDFRLAHGGRRTIVLHLTAQTRRLVLRHPRKVLIKTDARLGPAGQSVVRTIVARHPARR